ncbi:methylated-DNA--[protein]-cysteine S-methyltransferase [Sporosarcina sp. BI001-red]|uniref:methylated-DNA--[protein]-cysteine S-methyltransferase n=1 Tax=Sporosarcina sp. BI001-red TaxID=2282866 RepID=UPI000E26C359|nr:methylated-DNA--[protein]-cysteine S-methyltransferase [Sporosarcina sp. BI001-red]REB08104.1 methylated-DNA--[protein]-cysteine S-methyltransferase [Sporosarcina sp. BI001-red]
MQPSIYHEEASIATSKVEYQSPIGVIEIVGTEEAIVSILFSDTEVVRSELKDSTFQVVKDCYNELDEYFNGTRIEFTVPYTNEGTEFRRNVWQALTEIPYAQTASYRDIACSVGNEKAVRAVGTANGKNQLSILIPCHRIIGSNGTLTGYAGGLWRKEWLLAHEQKNNQ